MIAFARPVPRTTSPSAWHARFLTMLPTIRRVARHAFRQLGEEARDDAVHEAIANALVAFIRLCQQGREELAYPTVLGHFAVAQFRAGRRVGNRFNKAEMLSQCGRRCVGIAIERLEDFDDPSGTWIEATIEDRRTSVSDQAAFRCDFPAWLARQTQRDRQIAEALAVGETTKDVAEQFQLSRGRISQLRKELYRSWQRFHGEELGDECAVDRDRKHPASARGCRAA